MARHRARSNRSGRARGARRLTAVAILAATITAATVLAGSASVPSNAHDRGVVVFAGDSNITLAAEAIDWETTWGSHTNDGYVPVMLSRVGAAIRTEDCLDATGCTTYDFWKVKLGETLTRVSPDAIVSDLGINDTAAFGTPTTPGYDDYAAKIDWFMGLVPSSTVVLWTNLPCAIEPLERLTGCRAVDHALAAAPKRWPNFVLVDWAAEADTHPGWMANEGQPTGVHYDAAGDRAWTALVVSALDARFPPRT